MQATGGSDGKVLFFNSDLFSPGQLNQPCAAVQNIPSEDSVVCISWISGRSTTLFFDFKSMPEVQNSSYKKSTFTDLSHANCNTQIMRLETLAVYHCSKEAASLCLPGAICRNPKRAHKAWTEKIGPCRWQISRLHQDWQSCGLAADACSL